MDKQEVFNKSYLGLKKQKFEAAFNKSGICVYRNEDGTKRCAIGQLISDEAYDKNIEGCDVDQVFDVLSLNSERGQILWEVLKKSIPGIRESDIQFLVDLQHAHDKFSKVKENLEQVAKDNNLTIPE